MRPLFKQSVAEMIGTFLLVFVGCGAIMVQSTTGSLGHMGVALSFGLTVMIVIAATGHISGAHLNPAVTVAFAVSGHFRWRGVPFYFGGQFIGASLAAVTLRYLFGPIANLGATLPSNTIGQSLVLETILTAILMFVIISVATDTKAQGSLAAIMIGATVGLCALWGGPISGASMNPARSFGPALFSGMWQDQWIYWIGPVVGAIIGALLYQFIRESVAPEPQKVK